MTKITLFTAAALLISSGIASAQMPTQDLPDAANPTATPPVSNSPKTGTSDRPPTATMPDANAPNPATAGQAPASSEKMQPEMDSVGGGRTAPGAEKK